MKQMIILLLLSSVLPSFGIAQEQASPGYLEESERYIFYSPYWFNLHHFLYQDAMLREVQGGSVIDSAKWLSLEADDREVLDQALSR